MRSTKCKMNLKIGQIQRNKAKRFVDLIKGSEG
jgi:hypothetical protein